MEYQKKKYIKKLETAHLEPTAFSVQGIQLYLCEKGSIFM